MTVRNYFRLLTVQKKAWPTCVLILSKFHLDKVVTSPLIFVHLEFINLICQFLIFHRMPDIFSIFIIWHRQSFFTTVEQRG